MIVYIKRKLTNNTIMKIISISTRISPDIGGSAKQTFLLSKYCSEQNIMMINISCIPKSKQYLKEEEINDHFKVYYLPFHAPGGDSSILKMFLFSIKFFIFSILKIFQVIRKEKIDLIHAHTPLPSGFIAYFFYKLCKIPYFYTIHGLDIPTPSILKFDFKLSARNSIKNFVVSEKLDNYIRKFYKLSNVQHLPIGVEISKFYHIQTIEEKETIIQNLNLATRLNKEDIIIIYIGYMFLAQKVNGMIDFLNGFNSFLEGLKTDSERKFFKLLYIGEGEYSVLLKNKIKELKLEKQVIFLGQREDVQDILAISNLLALTSYIEGFPNVILEAMASKVLCIATVVGEIKHILGDTGYIIKPGDINGIEKSIKHYLSLSSTQKEKLIKSAYKRVKALFDIEIVVKNIIEYYYSRK